VDGTLLKSFEDNREDNGIAQRLGLTIFPALVLIDPKKDLVLPVSFGLASIDQIENNIFLQLEEEKTL
jgi:conjugal transfer pilus assembly protein TraF